MKKIVLMLAIVASAFILTSCASKVKEQPAANDTNSTQVEAAAPAHKDLKGEKL